MSSAKGAIVLSLVELSMSQSQRSWQKFNGNKLGGGSGTSLGFPGGSVVKNPPANARDMGSTPG